MTITEFTYEEIESFDYEELTLPSRIFQWEIIRSSTNHGDTWTLFSTSFDMNEIRDYTLGLGYHPTQEEEDTNSKKLYDYIEMMERDHPDEDISGIYDSFDMGFEDHYPNDLIRIITDESEIRGIFETYGIHEYSSPKRSTPTPSSDSNTSTWNDSPLPPDEDDIPF